MKQAYVPSPGVMLFRDVPDPAAAPGSLVLAVARVGICGSDIHAFMGKHPLVSFPLVQGHEFSGRVRDVGKGVTGFKPGDLVTVQPAVGCGSCARCAAGLFAQCDRLLFIGGALEGTGSELFLVDAKQAVRVPESVSADEAAMVEPLAVAVHAVRKLPDLEGRRVLVCGGGTIGNLVAQVARSLGAGPIVITERHRLRVDIALTLGLAAEAPPPVEGAREGIERLFGGSRPTAAFECAGGAEALNICIAAVERGGHVIVPAVYEVHPETHMILVQDKELQVTGSLMYTWSDYEAAVDLLARRAVDVRALQTHHFPFERWPDAYRLLTEDPGSALKVLIDVSRD
jgi:L-iditol 2-dehydrogenase